MPPDSLRRSCGSRNIVAGMLHGFLRALADFFFPPLCLVCRKPVSSHAENFLCSACAADITFTGSPLCPRCGILFSSREGDDHLCGSCLSHLPRFDAARSVGVYDGTLRQAIHLFKYRGGLQFARHFGRMLAQRGRLFFDVRDLDLIIPVPLHRSRLRERGYNQSAELARAVGLSWGVPLAVEGLDRVRATPQQTALSRRERAANVRGAFSWTGPPLGGKRVLLIDDVYTSGATADECSRVLKKAGAAAVWVLTIAHTQ